LTIFLDEKAEVTFWSDKPPGRESLSIFYHMLEPPHAQETVLLLPGLGSSKEPYAHQLLLPLVREERHFRWIFLDYPGFGMSPPLSIHNDHCIEKFAYVILEFLDALGIKKRVRLVGHSMGGAIALFLASHWPAQFHSMVIQGAPYCGKNLAGAFPRLEEFLHRLSFPKKEGLPRNWSLLRRSFAKKLFINYLEFQRTPEFLFGGVLNDREKNMIPNVLLQEAETEAKKMNARVMAELIISLADMDLSKNIAAIRTPTLLLDGDNPVPRELDTSEAIKSLMLHTARISRLSDAGHMAILLRPQEFIREARSFFLETP
jgi:pimeloyl-ACP methyl ester carboxylesterase